MTKVANFSGKKTGRAWDALRLAAFAVLALSRSARPDTLDAQLEAGFRAMYALDFPLSEKHFAEHERLQPADPLGYAAEAACVLFTELNRLGVLEAEFYADDKKLFAKTKPRPGPPMRERLFTLTTRAQQVAEVELQRDPTDDAALFALALANGVLADYNALIEHRYWASLKFGKAGYEFAQKLVRVNPMFYDAYVSTGATNYIVGSLPAPVRWLARLGGLNGNKQTGLKQLHLAAEKGRYLKPYAKILLALAYLRDKNKPAAAALVAELSSEFPSNPLFEKQAKRLATGSR